jgi:hypothetical protein
MYDVSTDKTDKHPNGGPRRGIERRCRDHTDQLAYVDSRHWETTLVRLRVVVRIHRHHTSRRATVT